MERIEQTRRRIIEEHEAVENALALYGLASDYMRMEVWGIYERDGIAATLRYIETMSHREAGASPTQEGYHENLPHRSVRAGL